MDRGSGGQAAGSTLAVNARPKCGRARIDAASPEPSGGNKDQCENLYRRAQHCRGEFGHLPGCVHDGVHRYKTSCDPLRNGASRQKTPPTPRTIAFHFRNVRSSRIQDATGHPNARTGWRQAGPFLLPPNHRTTAQRCAAQSHSAKLAAKLPQAGFGKISSIDSAPAASGGATARPVICRRTDARTSRSAGSPSPSSRY
jgi:hypothetical protein